MSIWSDWAQRNFGPSRARRIKSNNRAARRGGSTRAKWSFERLEGRRMLAVTSNFLAGTLTINLSGADTVALSAAGGNVQLSINGIGGFNPDSGVLQASNVASIIVTSTGNFANTIDLTGVSASDYSALLVVSLNGGDGSDTYKIDQSTMPAAAAVTVADTGVSGTDSLQLTSTGAGPETIGISDTQVTRSGGSAALSYSGLEQLTVNGTNGGDTINVTKTAAGTATIVNAGSGLDTFGAIDLTQIGAAGLTLHAGGNGEALTLNTTTAGTVSVSGTAVQRSGNGAVNYDGFASLLINGSSGADTFQVTSTSTPTTLDGKDGGDNYTVTHTGLAATLNVSDTGPTGSDQLTDSSSSAGPETIGISDTQVTRSGGSAALSYSGLEQLTVNGTNGGDTINVTKTAAGTATIVNAGSGLDTFGAIDLTQIGAAGLTLHAGGNGEALTLNTTTAGTVSVSGTAVQRSGNGAVNYDGFASLLINGSSGADTFQVTSTSTPTTLDGKDGGDNYTVTHTGLAATLNVSDTGPTGSDQLTDSSSSAGPETIGISDTQVTRSGGSAALSYSGLEQLTVNGTNGGDTINVTKTAAGTATIVNAGSGLDTFGAIDLTQIGAAGLTLHAGGNGEALTLNTTTAGTVSVSGTAVQRSGNGAVNYDGFASLLINGSSGADTFQVTSTSTPTTLDGKDGGDNYTVTHTGLAATLNVSDTGPTGSDQLTDSSSSAGPETIGISDTQVTRSGGSAALSYSGLEQLTVNGTNGGDTINVTKTAAGTATIVNAGSGLDTFGAIDLTQIGAAGLTLHAGGNGEALTLNTTTAGTVSVSGTAVQRSGNGAVNYDGFASLLINGSSGADTFQVTSTSTPTTLDGKDGGDNYTVTHTGLAATLNVSDTGPTGSDQLTDSSSSAGPETIGISDTQVTRSGGSAALSYSGLEQLTVNGTNGGDTINVTKTAAGTATIVNAGSGLDTFGAIDLTQIGAAGLTLHAGGNGEALTLNTTTAGTVSVSGTAVQRSGNGAVNYDGFASLLINGSSGADTFQVTSTSTPTTLDGKDGGDNYTVTHTGLAATLNVSDTGPTGSDQLTDSSSSAGPETIGISDTQVTRSGGSAALSYSGLEQLTVNGTNGGDTINVTKTAAGTATIVNAGSGLDTFGAIDLTQIGAAGLTLHAGGNGEALTLNTTTAGTVSVSGTAVQRSGNGAVNYDGFASLLINGSSGADTFQVTSTSTPTTLDGKDGGDNYTVTHTGLAATLNVSDTGPTGSDQLTDSSSSAGPETIGISDTQVTRSGGSAALSYSGLEQLTVNGTNGGDTINVTKTAAGTATIVNAGSGLDTFGAIDLTQIGAAGLTLHAGGNGEALTLNTTTAGTVSVSGTAVQRSGNGAVNYDGFASLLINGSSGADTFQVTSTSTPTTLDGKDGGDNYTVTHTGLAATLNVSDTGPTGSDQLTDSSSSAGPETIGISDTQVTRSGGSAALSYSGLEQLTVNGTNGGDTINVTKTAAGTATIVNAGSGLDTFGAIDLTQIGAAGLTLHAGGNGEALTLNTTTAGTVSVSGTAVQRSGNGAVNYDGFASLLINGSSGADTFQVTSTSTPTTLDGKDGGDNYTVTHTGLAATLNVSDTGPTGSDQLTDSSSSAGPETIGISDTQVTRSGGSAALSYSGLEQLTVNGTNGGDTINVTKTAAGTATIVNAGSGLDTFGAIDLTQIGAAGLTLHAGGNGEALTLNTTTAGTVSVSGTAVQRSGNGAVNYDGFASLLINGSSGADTFQVTSTSTPTTLDGKDGGDNYTVTHTGLAATLNVSDTGPTGSDQLTDSSSSAGPETIGISDTQVTRSGGSAALSYSGLEQLTVNGTNGGDTINVTKTAAGTATIVNAGSGLDTFGAIDLTQIGAAGLTLHAGGNGEALTLNTTTAGTVSVSGTAVQRSGNGAVNYDGFASLLINGSSGADTFQVTSTSTPTTLDGKDGGDNYTVTQSSMAGPLFVSDSVAGGTNQLTSNTAVAGPETISLTNSQIARSGAAAITYSGIQVVIVNGSASNDTINVLSTINGTTTVNGGSGNDTITVGNASHKLDDIQGSLTINGNDNVAPPAGGDTLILDDSGQTTGQKYTLTDNKVTRLNGPIITFGTIETLQLNSGSANDKFIVNFTAYPHSPAMTVKFNFGEALHANKDDLQINGTAGNDTILVGTTNSVLGEQFLLNDIDCLQMFGNAGNDVLVNDTAVSSLIDGGAGSDVLVGGTNTDVIFGGSQLAGQHDKDLLYGRGGNDILFADYDYNAGQPKILHQSKNNDQVFGDDAPSPAVAALYGLPNFAPGAPGIDTIVLVGSDFVSAGGQVGDTIIGTGLQQLTVVDWLRASFLKPTSKNIQAAINKAKQVDCFKTTF